MEPETPGGPPRFVIDHHFTEGGPSISARLIPASGADPIPLGSWSPTVPGSTAPVPISESGNIDVTWTFCGIIRHSSLPVDVSCDDCQQNACSNCVGDPVRTSSGNMRFADVDPLPGADLVPLTRTYDSTTTRVGFFGRRWSSLFEARARKFTAGSDSAGVVEIYDESGKPFLFHRTSSSAPYVQFGPAPGTSPSTLQSSGGGWIHADSDHPRSRHFDAGGRLIRIANAIGRGITITWTGTPLRPTRVEDDWGRPAWLPVFNTSGRIEQINFEGLSSIFWKYEYDGDRLDKVVSPHGTWRDYNGTGTGDNWRITSILDPHGNTIETHAYDADGRATDSYGPSGEIDLIEYWLPGRIAFPGESKTNVRHKTGRIETHYQRTIAGRMRTVQVDGGCAACGARNGTWVYDPFFGNVIRHQGADGYITENVYDVAGSKRLSTRSPLKPSDCDPGIDSGQCRLTPDALATAVLEEVSETVTTTFAYADASWPQRPTSVTIGSLYSSPNALKWRNEEFAYHPVTGETLTHTIQGWTAPAGTPVQQTRATSTSLYDGIEGAAFTPGGTVFLSAWEALPQPAQVRKSTDGPRSDVTDRTRYVHYPVDATVPARLRGRLAAVENAAGHITRFEDYDHFGNPLTVVDPNGAQVTTVTDSLGRRTSTTIEGVPGCDTIADPLCATDLTTSFTYHGAGSIKTEERPLGGVTAYEYDTRSRLRTVSRGPSATDLKEQIETAYDTLTGRKSVERTLAMEGTTWEEKTSESFVYYTDGQLEKQVHDDDTFVRYTYDPEGRIASVRDETHTTANTTYAYDRAGRLESVTQKLATAPAGQIVTSYGYDVHGNLTVVTDPNGNVTLYAYDDFGHMFKQASPVTGTTTYDYDLAGNLLSTTDANNAVTTRTYDSLSRVLTAVSTRAGMTTETVSWTYDLTTSPNGIGRLGSMSDPEGTTGYRYDRRGLLIKESRTPTGSFAGTTSYIHDPDGNRESILYPLDGVRVDYGFDYAQRPVSLSATSSHRVEPVNVAVTSAEYAPFGPLSKIVFGNGTTQTMTYDPRYRLNISTLTGPSGVIVKHDYTFDARSNVTGIADIIDPLDTRYSRTFGYDDLSRLVTANSGSSLWETGEYSYDSMGNMKTGYLLAPISTEPEAMSARDPQARPLSRRTTFTYDGTTSKLDNVAEWGRDVPTDESSASRRISSNSYLRGRSVTYDAAGNETAYFATRTYSPRNLMSRITDQSKDGSAPLFIEYGYDGRGVRLRRTRAHPEGGSPGTQRYHYSPELQLLAVGTEYPPPPTVCDPVCPDQAPLRHGIIWFAGRPVITFNDLLSDSTARYTYTDHLGTPILQTNQLGSVVWHADYEPFGNIYQMRVGERHEQPLRFAGQEAAMSWEGTEENYNIFRWYRSGWGRYTQADPLGRRGDSNSYSYVAGNPVANVDPLGLKCCVRSMSVELRPRRAYHGGGLYTNAISARICANVSSPEDCRVSQTILFVRTIDRGQVSTPFDSPTPDRADERYIDRSPNRICFRDTPGYAWLPASSYPLAWRGRFETTVYDRVDPTDRMSVQWEVSTICLDPYLCGFHGQTN